MFNAETIESLVSDLIAADAKIRKSLKLPEDMENPAQTVAALSGLAKVAASTAQSLSILLSNIRERELLEARLRKDVA